MRNIPAWLKEAVFYEIYPQSFYDTNGDGIGDINGITEKLDYIKSLGCNAIWMNPCFESPFGDAGYDISDYRKVAPRYGTNDDLKRLFAEAHGRGMHVILDLVPGHTSLEHKWFSESMKAERNEYSDRYIWTDSVWDAPTVGNITGWLRGLSERNGSCALNFFYNQPALNYGFYRCDEPWQKSMDAPACVATRKAMEDVVLFWLGMGCDGFRVDMASTLVKNDDEECHGIIEFWNRFFERIRAQFPNAAFVSEWGDPYHSIKAGFDMDFLLHFGPSHYMDLFRENPYFSAKCDGDISEFVERYKINMEKTEGKGLICIPTGNHDMKRMSYMLDETERRLAFAFILSMPGVPFIYYGDEIGMKYLAGIKSVEGGYDRTGSRSPMQWSRDKNAGFSTADKDKLYIELDPDESRPDAKSESESPKSLMNEVKKLIEIRQGHPALAPLSEIEFVCAQKNSHPLIYLRKSPEEKVLVAINISGNEELIDIKTIGTGDVIYSIGNEAKFSDGRLSIPGRSATFIKL